MNREIIAKDIGGVKRCYGVGKTFVEAMRECRKACHEYMAARKDIDALYLYYGDTERPVIDAARYETMSVKR